MHDRPNYPGGPIVNYMRLLPSLKTFGYDIHLIAFYFEDYPNARELENLGISIYPFKHSNTAQAVKQIHTIVASSQPDVFIPDVSTPGCFAGKWIKKSGIPVITTHRSDDEINKGRAMYFSDYRNKHTVSGIVCVSDFLKSQIQTIAKESGVLTTTIPSGVDIPVKICTQETSIINIAYAGRFIQKQKRIFELITSFLHLCRMHDNITFTMIGDGPDRLQCMEMVEKCGYAQRFVFTGPLFGKKYKDALLNNQIIVLFSDYEGTPGSLLDGMSCGLIPVCYAYEGADELIKDKMNGFLIQDRQESFYKVMSNLIESPGLRREISLAARKHIIAGYSIEETTKRWISFVEQCLKQGVKRTIFIPPRRISLPKFNPILLEDFRGKKIGIIKILRQKLAIRTRIKQLFKYIK